MNKRATTGIIKDQVGMMEHIIKYGSLGKMKNISDKINNSETATSSLWQFVDIYMCLLLMYLVKICFMNFVYKMIYFA